jgi:hypothetical protein
MTLTSAHLETNFKQLEPIDETHPAFMKNVDISGLGTLNEMFKVMREEDDAGRDPMQALGTFCKRKGLPFPPK